jgi:hypothetical protein
MCLDLEDVLLMLMKKAVREKAEKRHSFSGGVAWRAAISYATPKIFQCITSLQNTSPLRALSPSCLSRHQERRWK